VLTAVLMPPGHDADNSANRLENTTCRSVRACRRSPQGVSYGHLGECNELTLLGALTGVEMGFSAAACHIARAA